MKLRITAVLVLASVLPAAGLGLFIRAELLSTARAETATRLEAATASAGRRVTEAGRRERQAVERLCGDDIVVDRLVLRLEGGRFGPLEQDELVERLPRLMRSMGLVALLLIDAREGSRYGRVLAAGHFPGRAGADEAELARAVEQAGDRWFVETLRTREDGATSEVSALLTGCVVERSDVRVIAVGGRVLDDTFVETLAADVPPVHLFLSDADDANAGLPAELDLESGQDLATVHEFTDQDGEPVQRLVAAVDGRPLAARLEAFDRTLQLVLALTIVVALLLGLMLSFGLTRPLAELETAAARVASGDMETEIDVRVGGEVGKALHAFNRMTGKLDQAQARLIRAERIAAWRDIARRIAHEIKNPLTPIKMSIETMRKTHARQHPEFDEIFDESTLTILEEVERLQRIVTEFSRFARLPRPQPTDLAVEDVAQHVVGLHAGGEVEVRLEVAESLSPVRADREQLTQVLVNLVQNAADAAGARHGGRGGEVVVEVDKADDGVAVRIVDNGTGIPLESQARIFEPYYTTKAGGTGLGLAIVHRIVSDHGGTIEVGDSDSGGAVFEILLTRKGPPIEASTTQTDATVMPLVARR